MENGGEVKVWSVNTGECMTTMKGHPAGVQSVSFSPDGMHVASGSLAVGGSEDDETVSP